MKKGTVSVLSTLFGAVVGAGALGRAQGKKIDTEKKMSEKHLALFLMMNQWVHVKQEGKNLADYFVKNGYGTIAIYGMSYAGETLVEELRNTEVTVAYGIDKRAASLYADINIITMEDELENVDAVVVTPITFFDEIAEQLSDKIDCPIISLEDILYEV